MVSTPGRIIFNKNIPQDLGFVDRSDPEHICDYEITFTCGKKQLGQIVDRTINKHGFTVASEVLDAIKSTGYKYSTHGRHHRLHRGYDRACRKKYELVAASEQKVVDIENQYKMGFMTDDERYKQVVQVWEKTTNDVSDRSAGEPGPLQPHLHDGGLRRPWFHEADPSAGRYARPDRQYRR